MWSIDILYLQRAYFKFLLKEMLYSNSFISQVLWITKGIHCLNLMRYHDAFIENTCCHQPPSLVTQSIGIYDHFGVSLTHRLKPPLDFGANSISSKGWESMQYGSLVNNDNWWFYIMNHNRSYPIASHTLMHSPSENHPNGQDKSSLQLGGGALQSLLNFPNPWTDCGQFIYLQGTYDLHLLCNF